MYESVRLSSLPLVHTNHAQCAGRRDGGKTEVKSPSSVLRLHFVASLPFWTLILLSSRFLIHISRIVTSHSFKSSEVHCCTSLLLFRSLSVLCTSLSTSLSSPSRSTFVSPLSSDTILYLCAFPFLLSSSFSLSYLYHSFPSAPLCGPASLRESQRSTATDVCLFLSLTCFGGLLRWMRHTRRVAAAGRAASSTTAAMPTAGTRAIIPGQKEKDKNKKDNKGAVRFGRLAQSSFRF